MPLTILSMVSAGWVNDRLHGGLAGQIVDLVRRHALDRLGNRVEVDRRSGGQPDRVTDPKRRKSIEAGGLGIARRAVNFVASANQESRQVGFILTGNAEDKGATRHARSNEWRVCVW